MVNKVKEILNLIIKGKLEYSDLDVFIRDKTSSEWQIFHSIEQSNKDLYSYINYKPRPNPEYRKYYITVNNIKISLGNRDDNCWLEVDSNSIDISKSEYQILQKLFDYIKSLDAIKKDEKTIDKLNSIINACN